MNLLLYNILLFLLGLGGLYYGANFLVKGSSRTARVFGVRPLMVGLSLVAFRTSSPELIASLFTSIENAKALLMGYCF